MVSIKHLFFISLLVLFCLAEIVPQEAAIADDAQESIDDSHVDEGSDHQSTEAAAEQIASDGTEQHEGQVDTLNDQGKIGSGIVGGGYGGYSHSIFKGGRRYKFHQFRNRRLSSPIEIQIINHRLNLYPGGCSAPLIQSYPWYRCGAWRNIGRCSPDAQAFSRTVKSFTFRGSDYQPQCVGSDNRVILSVGSAGP